jgi:hypothetical protein
LGCDRREGMSEYMHLIGADDVRSAANSMRNAANDMQRAADTIQQAMVTQQRIFDTFLIELRDIMEKKEQP